jgi:hypothetical protein
VANGGGWAVGTLAAVMQVDQMRDCEISMAGVNALQKNPVTQP